MKQKTSHWVYIILSFDLIYKILPIIIEKFFSSMPIVMEVSKNKKINTRKTLNQFQIVSCSVFDKMLQSSVLPPPWIVMNYIFLLSWYSRKMVLKGFLL